MIDDKLKTIAEKGADVMSQALDDGHVADKDIMEVAMQGVRNHLIARNNDLKDKSLRFSVGRLMADNTEDIKAQMKKALPEYTK